VFELLLYSNTKSASSPEPLAHGREVLRDALGARHHVLFIPFARNDWVSYTKTISEALRPVGASVRSISTDPHTSSDFEWAEAIFVGGGNTFRLLARLQRLQLIGPIREAVARGALYVGSSAGTNVAAPSIRTSNDMPIVQPESFESLRLVPFQLNPHYLDGPISKFSSSETREQRLEEYLEENAIPVVGLREDTWLRVDGARATIGGAAGGARLFCRGQKPRDIRSGGDISSLLAAGSTHNTQ
jgi:dipeptidase E